MRVLILSAYPLRRPRFGGQLRAAAIVTAYAAAGHEVTAAGLYDPAHVQPAEVGPDDVPITEDLGLLVWRSGSDSDMARWRLLPDAAATYAGFVATARRARPDLVQVEEPACWDLAVRLRADGHIGDARLVHSSHNFETHASHELKASGATMTGATLADIAALERRIAAEADLIVTVSEADARAFRVLGASRVCVAPNAAAALSPEPDAIRAVSRLFGDRPFALFVSSGHPPNAAGLFETVAAANGSVVLRAGHVLVCGDVCRLIHPAPAWRRNQHIFARTRLLGRVESGLLPALYGASRIVVLPKTKGGGSSLKTAEALLSRRPVAMPRAFEGFEAHATAPGVHVAADGADLWRHVATALAGPPLRDVARNCADLLWPAALAPMVRAAEAVAGVSARLAQPEQALLAE